MEVSHCRQDTYVLKGEKIFMKIKNMFLSFLIVCSIIIGFPFISNAAESVDVNDQNNIKLSNTTQHLISDFSFIQSSTVKTFKENDGNYNITITDAPSQYQNNRDRDMREFSIQSISFFSLQEKEKNEILEYVSNIKNSSISTYSGGSIIDDDSVLGNSCYIYVKSTFTAKKTNGRRYCKLTKAETKYSVNSGTTVTAAKVTVACIGTNTSGNAVNKKQSYTVKKSSYTTPSSLSLPYIADTSPLLGAGFTVTAKRPSGTKKDYTVNANIISN